MRGIVVRRHDVLYGINATKLFDRAAKTLAEQNAPVIAGDKSSYIKFGRLCHTTQKASTGATPEIRANAQSSVLSLVCWQEHKCLRML